MPQSHRRYPPEYRQRMVELVRAGSSPEQLAKKFEPSAQTIRNWVKQADLDEGRRAASRRRKRRPKPGVGRKS